MKYLIITDHKLYDLRVSKSRHYLYNVTLQIPSWLSKFFWVPGYSYLIAFLTYFYSFDKIYCHDLFCSLAGVIRGGYVIADLHENFYDCYKHNKYKIPLLKFFFRQKRIDRMINKVLSRAKTVITVSEPLREIYQANYFYPNVRSPSLRDKILTEIPVIVHVGRKRNDLHLELINGKYEYYELSDSTQLQNQEILLKATIGIINDPPSEQAKVSSPNKLFTYMNYGICVVTYSHRLNVLNIINKYNCGIATDDRIEDLINVLIRDSGIVKRLGDNGRKAVRQEYNEQSLVKPIFDSINQ